jgi:hypothetical protein
MQLIARTKVLVFVENSISANSQRAYASELSRFEPWGGSLSADRTAVASYLTVLFEGDQVATADIRIASRGASGEAAFRRACAVFRAEVRMMGVYPSGVNFHSRRR